MDAEERSHSCVTQNVNGFGATVAHRAEWMNALKHSDQHGRYDIVLLQETHVESADIDYMTRLHARTWGFRVGAGCPQLSIWSPAVDKKGGVAILADPYGLVKELTPVLEEHWTPHFMAVTGILDGMQMLYICVYAPHQRGPREAFYRGLQHVDLPRHDRILVGGDFNCTIEPRADRSHVAARSVHESEALRALAVRWGLVDVVDQPEGGSAKELAEFHARTHTYGYTLPSGEGATARLDRWYTSADLAAWVADVEVCRPGARTDHQAVRLHLVNPRDPVRIRKPARVYPPPQIAHQQVTQAMSRRIANFHDSLRTQALEAAEAATAWEETKVVIRMEALRLIKQRRKTARATYRQKCRRLVRQEQRLLALAAGEVTTIEMVTDMMEAMTLTEGRGDSPLTRVRNAISDCMRGRLALRQRRLFQQGQYRPGKTSQPFFRRNSNKYADNIIHRLDAAPGHRDRGAHGQPNTMADAWTHIFQQQPGTEADRQRVLHWLGAPGAYANHLDDIMDPITEGEVMAAIKAAKPGKACGPDRLGNDWYRDFAALLAPVLVELFNLWFATGIVPASFLDADIFCLKKGGVAQNPLNFRPLSLMNTDYKILTRVLATRMSPKLPLMVHPNQNGFVPQRTIHATIDLFTAAQTEARRNPEFAKALAILLDFMKAYDSVDREFLYAVLLWLGFPPAFVAVMRALHTGTRVRFLANGYRSRWVRVTCGIRQGCPLAPLLFILVLEALYRRIDAHPRIHGITLSSRAGSIRLKVGGYADDIANYVKSEHEVPVVMETTTEFALASGLHLNQKKTMVIALNPDRDGAFIELPAPLELQATEQLSRYLGIQVGSVPGVETTWRLAHKQLLVRLLLAGHKTNTVDQRSLLVAAIVVPKLLYIGRHHWPSAAVVAVFQKRIHNFIWHGYFSAAKRSGRAWLNAKVAALPRGKGGIAEPNLTLELQAMAAATVAAWAIWSTPSALIVGDILGDPQARADHRKLMIGPRLAPPPVTRPSMGSSLWLTGARICGSHGVDCFDSVKAQRVNALHSLMYFRGRPEVSWSGRTGFLDMTVFLGSVRAQCIRHDAALYGQMCPEWVPHLPLCSTRLVSPEGTMINPNTRYRALCRDGRQIKDVVHWTWSRTATLKLTVLTPAVNTAIRRQVGHLVLMLILNFPELMERGHHGGDVRYGTKQAMETAFTVRLTNELRLELQGGGDRGHSPAHGVQSHRDLHKRTQELLGERGEIMYLHPHPRLARMVCLWAGSRRWALSRRHFKTQLRAADRATGRMTLSKSAQKWRRQSAHAATGLDRLHWTTLRRVVGLNPWGEQMLYRLKHHALSAFNPGAAGLLCPHPGCSRLGRIDLYHIFWTCQAAGLLRKVLYQHWQAARPAGGDLETEIFSLQLGTIPAELLQATGAILAEGLADTSGQVGDAVERILTQCWSIDAATYLHVVWKWHVAFFDRHEATSSGEHLAIMATRLRRNHSTIAQQVLQDPHDITAVRLRRGICQLLGGKGEKHAGAGEDAPKCVLVFYAGRATDEVSAGAAGVMIVETWTLTRRFRVLYTRGVHPAGRFRNGEAAAQIGLLHGLRVCQRRGWHHVHVVGDNAKAHRQLSTRKAPKEKSQQATFWTARRTADAIGVATWGLHPRERNRASRSLMLPGAMSGQEEKLTSQTSRGVGSMEGIMAAMSRDILHWWEHHTTQGPVGSTVGTV